MPYSGASDSSLPDYVKKLSVQARKVWVAAFNNSMKGADADEAKAFRIANGAVKQLKEDQERVLQEKEFTDKRREKLADTGKAMPGGRYPIESAQDLKNAIQAMGRGGADTEPIKAHIIKRARALGLVKSLPDSWDITEEELDEEDVEEAAYRRRRSIGATPPKRPGRPAKPPAAAPATTGGGRRGRMYESSDTIQVNGTILYEVVEQKNVFEVVLITAGNSLNGRRYPAPVLRESASLFQNARAYADHPTKDDLAKRGGNRSVREIVGWYDDVRFDEKTQALVGRLHVLESAEWLSDLLREMTVNGAPQLVGLSINAEGEVQTVRESDKIMMEVSKIRNVQSVDIVTAPAAGGSIVRLVAHKEEEVDRMDVATAIKELSVDELKELRPELFEEQEKKEEAETPPEEKKEEPAAEPEPEHITEAREARQLAQAATRTLSEQAFTMKLSESKLPKPFAEMATEQFTALIERRPLVEAAEMDDLIKRARDHWAAVENYNGSGRVRAPEVILTEDGRRSYGEHDRLILALDGMLANEDQKDENGNPVRRFNSFKEAYCRWTGTDPFGINLYQMFKESQPGGYDSALFKLEEAMTSASWAEVFSDRMYKRLIGMYRLQPLDDWRRIVSNIENVPDFRSQRRMRIGGYGTLPAVAENAPYVALTSPTDEEANFTVSKRGGLETITFETIVNDDMRAIRLIPTKLARAAANTLNRFVFDFLEDGFTTPIYDTANLFDNALHANVPGGATAAALTDAGLADAWQRMRNQSPYNDSNEHLGWRPKILVVPNELEIQAWKLANSAVTILSANYNATEPNYFNGKLDVVVVDHFTDANNWFLIADPSIADTIEIGFLHGNQDPELFVQDQPNVGDVMTNDRITYKIRHIYGGAVLDYRGLQGSNPT